MKWLKAIVGIVGFSVIFGSYLFFFYAFVRAYFQVSKQMCIDINSIGEANFEFVILIITIPAVIFFIIQYFKWGEKIGKNK